MVAGGFRYDNSAGTKLDLDVGYQTSRSKDKDVRTAVGNRIPELMLDTDDDGGARLTVPNAYLIDRTGATATTAASASARRSAWPTVPIDRKSTRLNYSH